MPGREVPIPGRLRHEIKPFRAHVTPARKVPHGSHDRSMQSVLWSFTD
jgi:hypothetical protein